MFERVLLASISVISKEVGDTQALSIGIYVIYEFRPVGLLWDGSRPLDSRLIMSHERGLEEIEIDHIIIITFVARLHLSSPAMVETCW